MLKAMVTKLDGNIYLKITFLLIFFIFLAGCESKDHRTKIEQMLELSVKEISIQTDTLASYQYDVFTVTDSENAQLITYNHTSHSLEFFDLNKEVLTKRVFLERDGPKALGNIKGLHYHNSDSIFVYHRGVLTVIDEDYEQEQVKNLFTLIKGGNLSFEPSVNYHFRLFYLPSIKSIPLYNIYYGPDKNASNETPRISFFDLENYTIDKMPYFHTEKAEEHFQYGFLNYPTISEPNEKGFFINQVYSPITYHYSVADKSFSEVIRGKHPYLTKNKNPDDWQVHAVESNFYNQLQRLNKQYLVRFVWEKTEFESIRNNFLQKRLKLWIYNNDFEKIKEIPLKDSTYHIYSWFIANEKIYLQVGHPLYRNISEEQFILHEISLEENEI